MQLYRTFFFVLVALSAIWTPSAAQIVGDTARLFTEMDRLHRAMRAAPVSFDIRYTYTSEKAPEVILDSLSGQVDISGANSRYRMAMTETISNGRYNIALFREDKLMYLTSPSHNRTLDPLQQLQALIVGSGISACAVREEKDLITISLRFEESTGCREMNMHINRETGYINDATYVLKTGLMMGAEQPTDNSVVTEYGEYAIVRVVFSRYRRLTGDAGRFDEHNYFTREGDVFKPAPAYSDYTIFKGSPNL